MFGYNYLSHYRLMASSAVQRVPLLFRGDSHRLVRRRGASARVRQLWTRTVFSRFARFLGTFFTESVTVPMDPLWIHFRTDAK